MLNMFYVHVIVCIFVMRFFTFIIVIVFNGRNYQVLFRAILPLLGRMAYFFC